MKNNRQFLREFVFWNPAEPTATRPLAINIVGAGTFFYTHDLTKNVCELISSTGTLSTTYDYAPFGAVTAGGNASTNPFQFNSEYFDSELGLVYYNYRHYSPLDGRWLSRDPIEEQGGLNLYAFLGNNGLLGSDLLGHCDDGNCFMCGVGAVWIGARIVHMKQLKKQQKKNVYTIVN